MCHRGRHDFTPPPTNMAVTMAVPVEDYERQEHGAGGDEEGAEGVLVGSGADFYVFGVNFLHCPQTLTAVRPPI